RRDTEACGDLLGRDVGVEEALGTGRDVRSAGVEDDGAHDPVSDHLARPDHRRTDDAVRGEDGGADLERPVVDDEREVRLAGGLEAGRDAARAKAPRCGHAGRGGLLGHGATPSVGSPSASGRPSARLRDWSAAPAVPLTRLSIAQIATTRRALASTATWTRAVFAPSVEAVVGHWPSGRTWTKGSPSYAARHASRTLAAVAPSASGAVTLARMPRDIGTSTGVKESRTSVAPATARFCSI